MTDDLKQMSDRELETRLAIHEKFLSPSDRSKTLRKELRRRRKKNG
jgi:hypothetical protein